MFFPLNILIVKISRYDEVIFSCCPWRVSHLINYINAQSEIHVHDAHAMYVRPEADDAMHAAAWRALESI